MIKIFSKPSLSTFILAFCVFLLLYMYTGLTTNYVFLSITQSVVIKKRPFDQWGQPGGQKPGKHTPSPDYSTDGIVTIINQPSEGKTKVLRFNGQEFERLREFCSWTPPFHCSMLKTRSGEMPIFPHDPEPGGEGDVLPRGLQRDENVVDVVIRELEQHPEAIFLDLGANVGIYTLTVAKTLRRVVIGVEPEIQKAIRLCKSIQENELTDKVFVIFNPLSDDHSFVDLERPKNETYVRKCPNSVPYITTCLDDLLPFMTSRTAIIKVHVDGFTYSVFKGGQRFLSEINVPSVVMDWLEVKKNQEAPKLVEMMSRRSYVPFAVDGMALDNERYLQWPKHIVWRKGNS